MKGILRWVVLLLVLLAGSTLSACSSMHDGSGTSAGDSAAQQYDHGYPDSEDYRR